MAIGYKPPPIGQFRKRMQIQTLANTATSNMETTNTPAVIAVAWCSLEPLSGTEVWLAEEHRELNMFQISMLYQSGIKAYHQGVIDGKTYNFREVLDVGELHVQLKILAVLGIEE